MQSMNKIKAVEIKTIKFWRTLSILNIRLLTLAAKRTQVAKI